MRPLPAALVIVWLTFGVSLGAPAAPSLSSAEPDSQVFLPTARGFNLGNMLEAPREGLWGLTVQEDYFSVIRKAGFTLIRVPICWAAHVSPAPDYVIDPVFLSRVDWVVAQAKKNDLRVILDYHNDDALMHDPAANADRFIAMWKQIAAHYQGEPSSILFELLNEPNDKLDAPRWNDLLGKTLVAVRATNPNRTIVVGPVWWNSIGALPKLVLPDDDQHLVVTIHFYDPMPFTHQGADWVPGADKWLGTTWQGTDAEKQAITHAFDQAPAGAAPRTVRCSWASSAPLARATWLRARGGPPLLPAPPKSAAFLGLIGNSARASALTIPRRMPGANLCSTHSAPRVKTRASEEISCVAEKPVDSA